MIATSHTITYLSILNISTINYKIKQSAYILWFCHTQQVHSSDEIQYSTQNASCTYLPLAFSTRSMKIPNIFERFSELCYSYIKKYITNSHVTWFSEIKTAININLLQIMKMLNIKNFNTYVFGAHNYRNFVQYCY